MGRKTDMTRLNRREALAILSASALTAGCASSDGASGGEVPMGTETAALKDLANEKGIRFGSAMAAHQIDDAQYAAIMKRDCATMVAENEHKMYTIQPVRGELNWAPADRLVGFAKANNIMMRGHTLVWHHPRWMPDWVNNATFSAAEAETVLGDYVTAVVKRYDPAQQIVVNSGTTVNGGILTIAPHIISSVHDGSSSYLNVDGTNRFTNQNIGANDIGDLAIGWNNGGNKLAFANMYMSEFIVYSSNQIANISNIESNINSYYSIY